MNNTECIHLSCHCVFSDKLYGDFEDLETGEVHEGEDEKGEGSEDSGSGEDEKTDGGEDSHNYTFRIILWSRFCTFSFIYLVWFLVSHDIMKF